MDLEFSREDLVLLEMLLSKAEVETRIEIHHCRTYEFKEHLRKQQEQIGSLLARVKDALAVYEQYPDGGMRCVVSCREQCELPQHETSWSAS